MFIQFLSLAQKGGRQLTAIISFYKTAIITYKKRYYTVIDFNEVDMRIYLPEKVIFTKAARLR